MDVYLGLFPLVQTVPLLLGLFFFTFPHALITFPGAVTKYLAKATKEWGSLLYEGTVHYDKGDIEAGW